MKKEEEKGKRKVLSSFVIRMWVEDVLVVLIQKTRMKKKEKERFGLKEQFERDVEIDFLQLAFCFLLPHLSLRLQSILFPSLFGPFQRDVKKYPKSMGSSKRGRKKRMRMKMKMKVWDHQNGFEG